jgi:hypothetical protein
MDVPTLAAVVHTAYLAMEMHSDDSNIQLGGCKIMFNSLHTGLKELPSFFQHAYIAAILSAVKQQQACTPFLRAAFPCLCSYYALQDWDVHCDHEILSQCMLATVETHSHRSDTSILTGVLFLLGVCLKHVGTRSHARLYSTVMLLLCSQPALDNESYCTMASHIMMLWARVTDMHCKEFLEATLVLLQHHLAVKAIHFTAVSTIRSVLHYAPIPVQLADRIVTLLGTVIRSKQDVPAILLCVDSMHVLFAKCPKFSKRFVHSDAFRAVVSMSKNSKNDSYLIAICNDLISSVSTKYPRINSL